MRARFRWTMTARTGASVPQPMGVGGVLLPGEAPFVALTDA